MRIIVFVLLLSLCGCTEEEVATFLVEAATGIEVGDDADDCQQVEYYCDSKNSDNPGSYYYNEYRDADGTTKCSCGKR